jgi:hypothetical protein|tara:strand:- start:556 stop:1323 length:768 start_codon:yes stop_codon:yes gene_type:complete
MTQAYFNYVTNGLVITFQNLSTGIQSGSSYAWTFGDGGTSTDKDPAHTYTSAGFFVVSLIVTTGADVTNIEIQVGVAPVGKPTPSNLSLFDMIKSSMPIGVTLNASVAVNYIRKWQDFIFPLVDPPTDELEKYLELCYSPLANQLVSELTVIDLIMDGANSFLLSQGNQTGASGKELKSITTGPAESEWFSGSDTWTEIMKAGGAYERIQRSACLIAAQLRISLGFCPRLPQTPIIPCVVQTPKTVSINKFDFDN